MNAANTAAHHGLSMHARHKLGRVARNIVVVLIALFFVCPLDVSLFYSLKPYWILWAGLNLL